MVIFKFFAVGDYEKEEKWINKMCNKGYALRDYSFGKFYFEPCESGKYYYSIELFENLPNNPSNEDFLNYLDDEWNVEYVCKHRDFAFFRREKSQGRFNLFADVNKKFYYFKRILTFRFIVSLFLLILSFLSFSYSYSLISDKIFSLLLLVMGILIIIINIPSFIKYKELKKEIKN